MSNKTQLQENNTKLNTILSTTLGLPIQKPDALSEKWSAKHEAILHGGASSGSGNISIKALTYANGYWLGIGNDSSNKIYKFFGTNQNMTYYDTGYNGNPTGIVYTSPVDLVWITIEPSGSGSYGDRYLIKQKLSDFKSSAVPSGYADISYKLHDITALNNNMWAVGEKENFAVSVLNTRNNNASQNIYVYNTAEFLKIPVLIKCCNYKNGIVAFGLNGQYIYNEDITNPNINYLFEITDNFSINACKQLNKHLVVAGTKPDGTYLYYTDNSLGNNCKWDYIKISKEKLAPIGLEYVNGLYVMAYNNANGKAEFWISTSLNQRGVYGISAFNSSFIAQSIVSDSNNRLMIGGQVNSTNYRNLITIP